MGIINKITGFVSEYAVEPFLEAVVEPFAPDLENMSQEHGDYRAFAETTYKGAREEIRQAMTESPDLPVFVGSFETHTDTGYVDVRNAFRNDLDESPAMAAAVTHIAALQAAVDLAGKGNVVLDVELSDKLLKEFINSRNSRTSQGLPYDPGVQPIWHVVSYALDHGIKINPSDVLHDAPDAVEGQTRYEAELESVGLQALYTSGAPRVLVHVGGAGHLGNFQGFSQSELLSDGADLNRNLRAQPLEGIYGAEVYLHTPNSGDGSFDRRVEYASDPANATQIDSPGRMSETDRMQLGQYVLAASKAAQSEIATQTAALAPVAVAPVQSLK